MIVSSKLVEKNSVHNVTMSTDLLYSYLAGKFMFMNVAGVWSDWVIGLILLLIALFILCTCLVLIVKILNDIFKGHIAVVLKKFINSDFPGNF